MPSNSTPPRLKLNTVVIRDDLYPRLKTNPRLVEAYSENVDVLPPIEVNQHNHLIDGRHRLTAYEMAGLEYIPVLVTETQNDGHLLRLACQRNASHGEQLSNADKQLPDEMPELEALVTFGRELSDMADSTLELWESIVRQAKGDLSRVLIKGGTDGA